MPACVNGVLATPTLWFAVSGERVSARIQEQLIEIKRTEDNVEPLDPGHAVYEVQTGA